MTTTEIIYRKKHPYYGKYKIKIVLDLARTYTNSRMVVSLCNNKIGGENYSFNEYSYEILVKDYKYFSLLEEKIGEYFVKVYQPAPGYENLEGPPPKVEPVLFYNRFPYRIILKMNRRNRTNQLLNWCNENCEGDYRIGNTEKNLTFYFMRMSDVIMAKLIWGDYVTETHIPDTQKAEELLKKNILKAELDLKQFLKGVQEIEAS